MAYDWGGDEDVQRMIYEYLLLQGHSEAADAFSKETGVTFTESAPLLAERSNIIAHLNRGEVEEAIGMVNTLNPEILETDDELAFLLSYQKLIEMTRTEEVERVLMFAHEEIVPRCEKNPAHLPDLERAMALLAFPSSPAIASLLSTERRHATSHIANSSILLREGCNPESSLDRLLGMVSALEEEAKKRRASVPTLVDVKNATLIG